MKRYGMPAQLKNGLVLHLPGVVSGTTAYDASGAGNNLTVNGSAPTQRAFGYKGFSFDGSTQFLSSSVRPVSLSGNATIFAMAKFNANSSSDHHIVNLHSSDNAAQMSFFMASSGSAVRLRFWSGSVDTDAGTTTVSDGKFYSLCATKSGSTISFYVNGTLAGTNTVGALSGSAGSGYYVGRFGLSSINFWKGTSINNAVWNRALSATEIQLLHKAFFIP